MRDMREETVDDCFLRLDQAHDTAIEIEEGDDPSTVVER